MVYPSLPDKSIYSRIKLRLFYFFTKCFPVPITGLHWFFCCVWHCTPTTAKWSSAIVYSITSVLFFCHILISLICLARLQTARIQNPVATVVKAFSKLFRKSFDHADTWEMKYKWLFSKNKLLFTNSAGNWIYLCYSSTSSLWHNSTPAHFL